MNDLAVVYLAYGPFGEESWRRFLTSYRSFPAGIEHKFVLACKAFAPSDFLSLLKHSEGIKHDTIALPDGGFDLGSYFAAAKSCESRYLCLLNSNSEILSVDWLAKMAAHISTEVGIIGATATLESHASSHLGYDDGRSLKPDVRRPRRLLRILRALPTFPLFPNFHLRTNAVLIARDLFLATDPGPISNKLQAYRFESGRRSLTRRVLSKGLRAVIAARDGVGYLPVNARRSHTFRSGEQRNLLVADNQTRLYAAADPETRRYWEELAWGSAEEACGF